MENTEAQMERLSFFPYRKPATVEVIPDSRMVDLERSIQRQLDFNEARRAAGLEAAGNYLAQ